MLMDPSTQEPHASGARKKQVARILLGLLVLIAASAVLYLDSRPEVVMPNEVENQTEQTTSTSKNASFTPELATEMVAGGLEKPWDIAYADGTLIVVENEGKISAIVDHSLRTITTLAEVNASGEGGLMGIAVDPQFKQNRYFYACYNTSLDVRISRWKLSENFSSLSEKKDIITGLPSHPSGRHSGCRLEFGPDNFLWVGTGDAAISTNPQDKKSLGGKILRVDREGNAAQSDNDPTVDDRVYSWGHRNIQGLAFARHADFTGVSVEHGTGVNDEVNLLKIGNFGWAPLPPYNESVPMTDTDAFPDAIEAMWSSGNPTVAPSGASFVYGPQWGTYSGRLFMAILKGKHIRVLNFSKDGKLQDETELYKGVYGRIRTVRQMPDGAVYFTTDNGQASDVVMRLFPIER